MKKLITENPVFVLVLGLCSALAVTTNLESAYVMGICLTFVLLFSNLIICLIKKHVNDNVRIPVYILIIGTFVTIIEILLNKYSPLLYKSFGIYLSLIVVNCIVLGRALQVATHNDIKTTLKDSIITGLGYTLALIIIALTREILGNGSITIINNLAELFNCNKIIISLTGINYFPLPIFTQPAGAFIVLGVLAGIFNLVKESKND